ncbi:hypothetical protein V6N13_146075 [Hibiscus sabdariffa]
MASSALTGKLENDVEINASPDKFIYMFTHRPHHMGNRNFYLYGIYMYVDVKAKTAKELVEAIDTQKNSITLRVLDGDVLEEYKSFVVKIQASPKSDGEGSVVHWTLEYERLHEGIGHPETLVPFFAQLTRDIDAHLLKQN